MVEYQTIAQEASGELVERRSRFIGYAKPVETEEEAVSFIHAVKALNRAANHNVYAYSLRSSQLKRCSDDGEPQGTAGVPVLEVLVKSGVTDAVVVVTRYFGGILLGTGGLVRAYSHSASLALQQAKVITMRSCLMAEVCCDYSQYGRLAALIPESGGVVEDTDFTDKICVRFHMSDEGMPEFEKKLAQATCGQSRVVINGEKFFEIS
jgi:uncharacterized YigZ family protein